MDLFNASPLRSSRARRFVDITAIACVLAGDTVGWLLFPSARPPLWLSPIFWVGTGLLAARHLVWPRPTVFTELWSALRGGLRAPMAGRLLMVIVVTRLGVLAVGLAASWAHPQVFDALPRISRHPVENLPARWDAFWYHEIARRGYRWSAEDRDRQQNVAFFPGYPLLMRTGGDIVAIPAKVLRAPRLFGGGEVRSMWGGVLASLACFTLATWRLFRLADLDSGDRRAAFRACVLLASYPFALFFSVPYSESLALLALISLTLAWRRTDLASGVLWGVVLGLCRSNGWTIAVALTADRLLGGSAVWKHRWAWVPVAAAPLAGAAVYSAYLYSLTGHAYEWVTAQRAWGGDVQPTWFFVRRWVMAQETGFSAYIVQDPVDAVTGVAVVFMIGVAAWIAAKRQWLYAALMVGYIAPAIALDLPASGRMTSLLFPAFIVVGSSLRRWPFAVLVAIFAIGQAWLAWRFFSWSTPY